MSVGSFYMYIVDTYLGMHGGFHAIVANTSVATLSNINPECQEDDDNMVSHKELKST